MIIMHSISLQKQQKLNQNTLLLQLKLKADKKNPLKDDAKKYSSVSETHWNYLNVLWKVQSKYTHPTTNNWQYKG